AGIDAGARGCHAAAGTCRASGPGASSGAAPLHVIDERSAMAEAPPRSSGSRVPAPAEAVSRLGRGRFGEGRQLVAERLQVVILERVFTQVRPLGECRAQQ